MSALVEFLLARIAEDEADALELHYYGDCDLARHAINDPGYGWECTCGYPDRVRAECEAKRRIIAEHPHHAGYGLGAFCETCVPPDADGNPDVYDDSHWPCPTLRALALPYADHADYREEWRP